MAGAVNVYNPSTGKRGAPGGGAYVNAPAGTTAPVVTPVVTPTTPVVTPTNTVAPVQQSVQLPFSKDTATYKALVGKGYTDQMIVDAYQKAKSAQPANVQVSMTKQEQAPIIKPTVVKPIKPVEIVKTPQQIQQEANVIRYSDNSEARMAEITNNLNQMAATNPNALKDVASFRGAYSYNQRSPEQQAVLSNRYTGYKKGVDLGLKPTQDIVDGFNNSTISSTDLESLKLTNPTKYADVQTGIEGKKAFNNFKDMLYGKEDTTTTLADTSVDTTDTSSNLFDEYKAAISSPEVTGLQSSMANQDGKITNLKLELTKIQNDVEKTYEGSGASTSKIAAIVADQQQDIQNQISKLSIDQNTSINKYNSIVGTAKDLMTMGLQEKSAEQADRQAKMNELGFFYQSTPEGISQMATMKYNAENPDLNSTNPVTQKMALNQALDGYYKEYSDIIQRPKAQAVTDILNYAKSKGISVSQALKDNFVSPLQGKTAYKNKIAKDYGTQKSVVSIGGVDYMMDANGNFSLPNLPSTPIGTGNIVPVSFTNLTGSTVTARVDSVAQPSLQSAMTQMNTQGLGIVFNQSEGSYRTNAQQGALYDKLHGTGAVAQAGKSAHNSGLAIDIYSDGKLSAPTNAQISIMNSNGWYQTAGAGDKGHFEYKGNGSGTGNEPTASELAYFAKGALGIDKTQKDGLTQQRFNEVAQRQQNNPSSLPSKEQTIANRQIQGLIEKDTRMSNYKAIETSYSKINGIVASGVNKQNKSSIDQALIILFNKMLDPTSVVREGEYSRTSEGQAYLDELSAKYNKYIYGGQGINDNTRTEMLSVSKVMFDQAKSGIKNVKTQYLNTVSDLGGTENLINNYFRGYEGSPEDLADQFSLDDYYTQYSQGVGTIDTSFTDYPTN